MIIVSCRAVSQSPAPPEKLDLNAFPGEIVDKVVIPVPAEVFAVLDKIDEPNWSGEIHIPNLEREKKSGRIQLSLQFGALVAEGFVAVQAENVIKIKDIGELALKLGRSLGLGDAVQPHSLSVVSSAEKDDWAQVRSELDQTQTTVREKMAELRDDDLANLVSLGGWIRGTNALTTLISDNFTQDKAELLNQPVLVTHFIEAIDGMSKATQKDPDIVKVRNGLVKMKALMESEDAVLSSDDILAIDEICHGLLELFYFPPGAEKEANDE